MFSLASWLARIAATTFGVLFTTLALAQSYPDRPVHLLVAFPPGGGANFVARVLAQLLSDRLGQSVVVENRPGSNGNVAGELVARAAADGYTVLQSAGSLLTVNPHLYATCRSILSRICCRSRPSHRDELLLTENPALEPKGFSRLHRLRRPRQTTAIVWFDRQRREHHLAMELLKEQAGIQMTHVPYRGGGPAALGVMAAR